MNDITKIYYAKKQNLISLVEFMAGKFFSEIEETSEGITVKFYAAPLNCGLVREWCFQKNFYNKHLKPFFKN